MMCPICKNAVALDAPAMPFCSERCRLIDLGKWADEDYVISTPADDVKKTQPPEEDEDE
jgi:endogenous inhibitor of DNA gyrase (YacG/DUF329 family)